MNHNRITPALMTAARYREAAAAALRQAVAARTEARLRVSVFDRYLERKLMRTFALEWRFYRARAQHLATREARAGGELVESAA